MSVFRWISSVLSRACHRSSSELRDATTASPIASRTSTPFSCSCCSPSSSPTNSSARSTSNVSAVPATLRRRLIGRFSSRLGSRAIHEELRSKPVDRSFAPCFLIDRRNMSTTSAGSRTPTTFRWTRKCPNPIESGDRTNCATTNGFRSSCFFRRSASTFRTSSGGRSRVEVASTCETLSTLPSTTSQWTRRPKTTSTKPN